MGLVIHHTQPRSDFSWYFSYLLGWIELLYHNHSSSTRVYRPRLIGVNRSKLLPSTHVLRHLRPSSLDPDPRSSRPDILVTMVPASAAALPVGLGGELHRPWRICSAKQSFRSGRATRGSLFGIAFLCMRRRGTTSSHRWAAQPWVAPALTVCDRRELLRHGWRLSDEGAAVLQVGTAVSGEPAREWPELHRRRSNRCSSSSYLCS
jgi:hypothetical protein